MKYLFLTNYFYPEFFRGNDIAFDLASKGHDVTVITNIPNYPRGKYFDGYGLFKRRREVVNGVKVIRVPVIPRGQGRHYEMVLNYVSGTFFVSLYTLFYALFNRFDAIIVQELSPVFIGIPAVIAKWIRRKPIVFWILDIWPESLAAGGIKNKQVISFVNGIVKWIYRHCDKLLISSLGFRRKLHAQGVPDEKIIYFPNWCEDDIFNKNEEYKVPNIPDGFKIMFAGNIGAAQNFENILKVAKRLSHINDLKWIIVGDGRYRHKIEEFIEKNNMQDKICLVGRHPIDAMPLFFEKADVMLVSLCDNPAFNLTLPAKVQAYMACKKPIIGMLNGEGKETIEYIKCGYAADANDVERMCELIVKLKETPQEVLEEMGNRGYQYYLDNFQKKLCMSNLEEILKEVH